jgi:integrase
MRRHELRHTGLTWIADARVQVHVLRKIAGHGSLVTTQSYLHPIRPGRRVETRQKKGGCALSE